MSCAFHKLWGLSNNDWGGEALKMPDLIIQHMTTTGQILGWKM